MIQTASYTDPGGRPGNEDTVRQAAREGGRLCVLVADGLVSEQGPREEIFPKILANTQPGCAFVGEEGQA